MDSEIKMSEAESMQLITSMINKAKNRFNENGFLYLLWGWVVLGCCLAQFIIVQIFDSSQGYLVWILTWVVVIYQIIYLRRRKQKDFVQTYTGEITAYIWIAFVIAIAVSVFVCIQFEQQQLINPVILVLYGIPVFLSGGLLKFSALIYGGIFCWLLAFISPFVNPNYQVLLIGAAITVAWIIPGYLLRYRYLNQMKEGA
jgi:hypothetical protein